MPQRHTNAKRHLQRMKQGEVRELRNRKETEYATKGGALAHKAIQNVQGGGQKVNVWLRIADWVSLQCTLPRKPSGTTSTRLNVPPRAPSAKTIKPARGCPVHVSSLTTSGMLICGANTYLDDVTAPSYKKMCHSLNLCSVHPSDEVGGVDHSKTTRP